MYCGKCGSRLIIESKCCPKCDEVGIEDNISLQRDEIKEQNIFEKSTKTIHKLYESIKGLPELFVKLSLMKIIAGATGVAILLGMILVLIIA